MKTDQILLYGGGALAAYFLFLKPGTTTSLTPGTTSTSVPGSTTATGLIGINSGITDSTGSFYTVSNYNQLLAANPNLGNPNYQMTSAELNQYLANYLDLRQGLPTWIGKKSPSGQTISTMQQAEQVHWQYHGCAEKRIFLPLQPTSNGNYVPPPVNTASSGSSGGSSWVSSALGIATTVIGLLGPDEQLNDADCQALFTMSAIIKDILPLYAESDPILTRAIETRMNALLTQYS